MIKISQNEEFLYFFLISVSKYVYYERMLTYSMDMYVCLNILPPDLQAPAVTDQRLSVWRQHM